MFVSQSRSKEKPTGGLNLNIGGIGVSERTKNLFDEVNKFGSSNEVYGSLFKNKQMFDQLGATDATSTSSNSSQFMTIEAGVDLFNFDSNTEQWVINTKCEFPVHNVFDEEGNALDALYPSGS